MPTNLKDNVEQNINPAEALKFEKFKYKIELFKWLISSFALVVMTAIINYGFKDRAVGMQEIQQYDKYVSELLVLNKDPGQKRMLAQFFSNVTPSKTLKDGWKSYYKQVDSEYQKSIVIVLIQDSIAKAKALKLARLDTLTPVQIVQKRELDKSIAKFDSIKNPPIIVPSAGTQAGDFITATYNESKGFTALLSRDVDSAINYFEASNRSYSTYHQVYEIARYLRTMRKKILDKNSTEWIVVYKTLLTKYSWGMSDYVKGEIQSLIK